MVVELSCFMQVTEMYSGKHKMWDVRDSPDNATILNRSCIDNMVHCGIWLFPVSKMADENKLSYQRVLIYCLEKREKSIFCLCDTNQC